MCKVSVIVPCYNAEVYLQKCLAAFERQSYRDFEVIFVDDCSNDNTFGLLQDKIDKMNFSARVIRNETNLGPSLSRKRGIENSCADYITFCDSDDWYADTFLTEMVKGSENSSADIVFCNYRLVYDSGRIANRVAIREATITHFRKELLTINIDGLCCGMFRRTLFHEMLFPDLRNGEDMAIIPLLVSKARCIGFNPACIYNYYQRPGSLSTKATEKMIECNIASFRFIFTALDVKFPEETEFLGVRNVLYGGLLAANKLSSGSGLSTKIQNDFERQYPNWHMNKYVKTLPKYKRVFLHYAHRHDYFVLSVLTKLHTIISR